MTFVGTRKPCYLCGKPMASTGIRFVTGPSGIGYKRAHGVCPKPEPIVIEKQAPAPVEAHKRGTRREQAQTSKTA